MFYIKRLELENFCNISKAELNLDASIIFLSGKFGQGKSAILDAVALCLADHKRADKYSDYIKQGTTKSHIILEAILLENPIHFDLTITDKIEFIIKYKDKVYKNTEAKEFLKTLDLNKYSDIILNMQKDADITTLTPSKRKEYLQSLLEFEFKPQIEKIKEKLGELNENLIELKNQIKLNENLIITTTSQIKPLKRITISENEIETQKNLLVEKKEDLKKAQDNFKKIEEFSNQINDYTKKINSNLDEINAFETELNNFLKKKDDDKNITLSIQNINFKIEEKETETTAWEVTIDSLNTNIEQCKAKYESLKQQEKSLLLEQQEMMRFKKLLSEKKCPHCGQDTIHIAEVNLNKFDGLSEKLSKCQEDLIIVKKDLDASQNEFVEKKTKINENKKLLSVLFQTLDELLKQQEIFSQLDLSKEYTLRDEINKLKNDNVNIKNEIAHLERQKETIIKFSNNDISNISNKISDIMNFISNYESQVKENEIIAENNTKLKSDIQEYENKIVELNNEIVKIISRQDVETEAQRILEKDLPTYMVIKTCSALEEEMNNFIQTISPNYSIKLLNNKQGVDFYYSINPSIKDKWINTKMSSGFEKDLITMAFKISLAKYYGLDFLILDECEAAADFESSEKLFNMFFQDKTFNQIFTISHKEELLPIFQSLNDNVLIYKVENGKFSRFNG